MLISHVSVSGEGCGRLNLRRLTAKNSFIDPGDAQKKG
jgi:hypothetical protein